MSMRVPEPCEPQYEVHAVGSAPAGPAGLKCGLIRLGSRVSAKTYLSRSAQLTYGGGRR
jgi:hypothetical protein